VSAKKHRDARAAVYHEAKRRNLWKRGEELLYAKWYRKLLAFISPATRKRYSDAIGAWYKRNLKAAGRRAYEQMHDADQKEFRRVQRTASKRYSEEQVKEYIRKHAEGR